MADNAFLSAASFGASGSEFMTAGQTTKDSNVIVVDNIGDFKVGDEILVIGGNIHNPKRVLFDRRDTSPINPRRWNFCVDLGDSVEHRGYDGTDGAWVVYYFDIYPESKDTFRWTKDFGRTWHENVPLSDGWITLCDGTEVKISDFPERHFGCTAAIVWSSRLIANIEKIEENRLYLSAEANIDANCKIVHSDTAALQRAIDAAISSGKNLLIPNGRYRITSSLYIKDAKSFTLQGESTAAFIDNSLGNVGIESPEGSCFIIDGGTEVNLKNISMEGSLGFDGRDMAGNLNCRGGDSVWGFYLMKSNATCVHNTERVYIENCHAKRMSAECFYASGDSRKLNYIPEKYCRSLTYMRCTVEDCARNAFNNNDQGELTSLLYCKVKNVGGCAWEGANRFVKIEGCYFNNAGSVALGNVRRRLEDFEHLGTGQHTITNNFFEGGAPYGDAMIIIGSTASQVCISNNTFINFNSNAIYVLGATRAEDSPPENIIIRGNSIDLTAEGAAPKERYGIRITAPFVTASDNHIYVRGECDKSASGIIVSDDATRINIHDNTVCALGVGIASEKVLGCVGEVSSDTVFYRKEYRAASEIKPMLLRRRSHRYRSWILQWLKDGSTSVISDFDPITKSFTISEPRDLKSDDEFYIYPENAVAWNIHHNIIDGCERGMCLDTFSGRRAELSGNLLFD